ncbi:MAG: TRAP transporter large permease subunit [Mesorhizobium sp.]|nr:TRAP transporter large permease subunit [Mesorhizobium sp.]MCO5160204.1 TRAP transporter large permease subunit [Mesorhizobium sp.]
MIHAEAFLARITQAFAFVGVVTMLVIAVITSLDVLILRALLNRPIAGSNELTQTIFSVGIAAVLASGLAQRANLRVDVLSDLVGQRTKSWITAAGSLVTASLLVVLGWRVFDQASTSMLRHSQTIILELPLAPFQYAISALIWLCVPVQILVTMRDCVTAAGEGSAIGRAQRSVIGCLVLLSALVVVALAGTALIYGATLGLQSIGQADPVLVGGILFVMIWVLVLAMVPVGVALACVGVVGTAAIIGVPAALKVLGSETTALFSSVELALIPLFLMMGSFAVVSGLSEDVYRFSQAVLGPFRGGLAMATIGGSAGFGALTGSSIATAVTIGSIGLPEMRKRGYDGGFSAGCVAAGATLGVLIPPSTIVVLYGVLTEQSIGKLYIAILVPGLISVIGYLATIWIIVRLRADLAPDPEVFSLRELIWSFRRSLAMFVLFGLVIGGIFFGVFTPTEAAAVGAVLSFIIALARGAIRGDRIWSIAAETTQSVAMIYVLIMGALLAAYFFALTGIPNVLAEMVAHSGLPPIAIIIALCATYLLLGTVMDSVTIMLITASLVAPIVTNLGYDPLWWGVITVMLVELGVLTPPFGVNLFLLKQLSKDIPITRIYAGVLPFVLADIIKICVLVAIPAIITWLPGL